MSSEATRPDKEQSPLQRVAASRDDIMYAAGLFDGEGCVTISFRMSRSKKHPERRQFTPSVSVTSTERSQLVFLQERWGGYIGQPTIIASAHFSHKLFSKPRYAWSASYNTLLAFGADVGPHLKLKGKILRNALRLARLQHMHHGGGALADKAYTVQERFWLRHKALSPRGKP